MNLLSKNNIKKIFQEQKIKPSKYLGQNFLINKTTLKKFIQTINPQTNDIILEIGPGVGTITQKLAPKVKKVITVEKDFRMVNILKNNLKEFNNVQIIQKDILNYKSKVMNCDYKVVGNLPFYLTNPVIRKFLENSKPPKEMILIIQKEVAQRICAKPPSMNFLAIIVQFYAEPKIVFYVSKKSFYPKPKVDSAIIKITPLTPLTPFLYAKKSAIADFLAYRKTKKFREQFFKIASAGFSYPRKYLINNLSKNLKLNKAEAEQWLLKNNIKPNQRAENLTIQDWVNLTHSYKINETLRFAQNDNQSKFQIPNSKS